MGPFEKGTQGAFFLKVIGWSGGSERVVIEHITRIHPSLRAATGRSPTRGWAITASSSTATRSSPSRPAPTCPAGPAPTAATPPPRTGCSAPSTGSPTQKPGIYDGLEVPLRSVLPPEAEVTRWA